MSNRKPIGRTLTKLSSSANQQAQVFTLASGKKATFSPQSIAAGEVADKTFVDQQTNGRDQQAVTKESVADIARTIGLQQFMPVIGRNVDDKIEILDGSRRRAAAIFENVGLFALVTDEKLSSADARQLAKDIQTAKEHNLREIGQQLAVFESQGLKQKEIAKLNGLSEAKVSRALQAAKVPESLLSLFPDQAELSFADYKFLLTAETKLKQKRLSVDELVGSVQSQLESTPLPQHTDDAKAALIGAYKQHTDKLLAKPQKSKAVLTKLHQFDNKNQFARKRVDGRKVNFEFQQIPEKLQVELEQMIKDKLEDFYS